MPAAHFRADIQALRGMAVLLVVLFHAFPGALPGGYVGVDVFFVISGYLITGLLLRELEATGRIDFKDFYARRIRRLVPAAALVIVATVAAVWFVYPPLEARELSASAIAAAAYVSNIWFALLSIDYLQEGLHRNHLLHTWSLGVEEQFYLTWPALLVLCTLALRRVPPRRAAAWTVAAVCVLSFVACVWLTTTLQSWAFFSLPTRAWQLGVGAAAVLLERRTSGLAPGARAGMAYAGLACILAAALTFSTQTRFPGYAALLPVLGAFLIVIASSGLQLPALQQLGDWSYSWYLWHWPILILLADVLPTANRSAVAFAGVAASLFLAAITYRYVENPVRHHEVLRARPWNAIAVGLMLMIGTAAIAAAGRFAAVQDEYAGARRTAEKASRDRPRLYQDRCFATALDTEPPVCSYGRADARRTVVLVGDSHAAQWFPALESLAAKHGWRVAVFVKAGCPFALVEPFDPKLNRFYTECTQWREKVFQQIAALRPTLVVGGNASFYAPFVTGDQTELERWRQGLEAALRRLGPLAQHVAVIGDTPNPRFNVPTCLARAAAQGAKSVSPCVFKLSESIPPLAPALERAVVAQFPGAVFIDVAHHVCGTAVCPVERDRMVLFHDSQHITATLARSLAETLWAQLPAAARQTLTD